MAIDGILLDNSEIGYPPEYVWKSIEVFKSTVSMMVSVRLRVQSLLQLSKQKTWY